MTIATSVAGRLHDAGVAYAPQIARAARSHGLDPALLAAVAAQETGGPGQNGGANVVGDGGHGRGLFQIDDRWHAFAASPSAMDPAANADYAAGMLSGLIRRYGGNVHAALCAYNAGSPSAEGTRTRWGDGAVLGYADSVFRHYEDIAHGQHVESARAEIASTAQSVSEPLDALTALRCVPTTAFVPPPAHRSWSQIEGLDAAGNARDRSLDPLAQGDDD